MQLQKTCTFLFFLLIVILNVNLKAQNLHNQSSFLNKTDFKIGYFGDLLWSNGISIGGEYNFKEKVKIKQRKRGHKKITRQFLINGSIGYTTNFSTKTENGLISHCGIIMRRVNPKGKLLNLELNPLGYYRSFLPKTYEVKDDNVSKVKFAGRGYYAPSLAIGIGKYRKEKTNTGWYLNFRYSVRTPYNAGTLPVISFEYGYRFNFKNNSKK